MDAPLLIDAQFDRAVHIVQTLPKAGPIQTGYEEKLAMYSLYKQATVGNVEGSRPGIWDMLGRAKWDAWAKVKDVDAREAKWRYVDQLLRVLHRYADKHQPANDLITELESFARRKERKHSQHAHSHDDSDDDSDSEWPSNPLSLEKRQQHDADESTLGSSYHTVCEEDSSAAQPPRPSSSMSTQRYKTPTGSFLMSPPPVSTPSQPYQRLQQTVDHSHTSLQSQRSRSSFIHTQPSSDQHHVYRSQSLPMTSASVSAYASVANVQPMPSFETPSAFPGPSPPRFVSDADALRSTSGSDNTAYADPHPHPYPANMYPGHPAYRPTPSSRASHSHSQSPHSRQLHHGVSAPNVIPLASSVPSVAAGQPPLAMPSPLQRAVENLQVHLAALQERMDVLESRTLFGGGIGRSRSGSGVFGAASGGRIVGGAGRISPENASYHSSAPIPTYDRAFLPYRHTHSMWIRLLEYFDHDDVEAEVGWDHMGLWSVVLRPSVRILRYLLRVFAFVLAARSPGPPGRSGDGGGLDAAGPMGGMSGRIRMLSPAMAVLRRLLLDAAFVLVALLVSRRIWRRSGARRREVIGALLGVWRAILGGGGGGSRASDVMSEASMHVRTFVERGV